jgi:glycosyltransferase involved in cell wall biosynthesis
MAAYDLPLSVVVPLFNEEASLEPLVDQLLAALRPLALDFELVLVDDGSRDTDSELPCATLAGESPEIVAVLLRRNYGQTAAMAAGFDDEPWGHDRHPRWRPAERSGRHPAAAGAGWQEGYDLVSGWRHQRQDAALSRPAAQPAGQRPDRPRDRCAAPRLRLLAQGLPPRAGSTI